MNPLTILCAVLQEPSEKNPPFFLVVITIALAATGILYLILKTEASDYTSPTQNHPPPSSSNISNLADGCLGCFGAIIKFLVFIAVLIGVVFLLIKGVKFVWYY